MALLNSGRDFLAGALTGAGTFFNSSNAHLGVGDSTTAYAASQTDLQAATNKHREIVDGAPGVSANVVTFIATFEAGDANYAWQEFITANASSAGTAFNRVV